MPKEAEKMKNIGLEYIPPHEIEKNPHNPRVIFDEESLAILKESIKTVGILVPLTVYRRDADGKYIILDGERRWRCALDLKLKEVPANIISEPSMLSNILTMFNIHNVREPWDITPTALKLEIVMRYARTKNTKKLAVLTGMTTARVFDCKKLLMFDKSYLDMTIKGYKGQRLSGDFFVQLAPVLKKIKQHYPQIFKKYGWNGITERMLEKYAIGAIPAVNDFRVLLRTINASDKGVPKERINEALIKVIEDRDQPIRTTYETLAKSVYETEKLSKAIMKLVESLASIDSKTAASNPRLMSSLNALRKEIERILRLDA